MIGAEFLIGSSDVISAPLPIFSEEASAFLSDLSAELMRGPHARTLPDVVSVGFWARRANVARLREARADLDRRIGRGLAFHIAPSNIPVNFAFSYMFGLVAGCANVVRVPSRDMPQIGVIVDAIGRILPRHEAIASRTAFVRYPRGSDATASLSSRADVRVIWGGDDTVAQIRSIPAKPRCVDICFADRYSVCAISAPAVDDTSDDQLARLAQGFFSDTYLMDQDACSSPRLIFWLDDRPSARERFWRAVAAAAERYEISPVTAVEKMTRACVDAASRPEAVRASREAGTKIFRVELSSIPSDVSALRGRAGYFYEHAARGLDQIVAAADERWQTITCFGVDTARLRDLVISSGTRGIDRIVPIGAALDIGPIWDGYDLVSEMSRIVEAR